MKLCTSFVASLLIVAGCLSAAHGQTTKYWDIDTIDQAGAGGATPSGTWDTGSTANWNTNSDGTGIPTTWTAGDNAVFSAGTDATGAYTVTVSGTQSLNALTVEEGTVQLGTGQVDFGATNGSVTVNSGATLTMVGAGGTINGTNGITKNGTGTLLLGSAAQPYNKATGAILTINSGVVEFTATGSTSGNDNALGTVPATAQAAALTINGGTLRWNGTAAHTLSLNRGVTIGAAGGTIEVVPTSNTGLSLPSAAAYTLNGAGTLTKTGAGRFTLNTTSNSFTGKYIVNAGEISVPGDGRFGLVPVSPVADYFILNGGALRDSITSGSTWNANRGITLGANGGTLMQPGAGTTTDSLTYNGVIAGTAGGNLTINSTGPEGGGTSDGIVILGGHNTYDGATTSVISAMTLRIGAGVDVIPDTSKVALIAGTTLDLNGFSETIKSISGAGGTAAVGTATLTLDNPAGDSYTGLISASTGGKVIKNGSGALSLNGASTGFNGEFDMNTGTLGIGNSSVFGNASNTSSVVITGGTLSNTATNGRTIPAPIPVALNGDFAADDSLFNSSTPGQILFNGPATMNANRIITVNGTANLAFADLRESGGIRTLTKQGNGTLALSDAVSADPNAFTGDVTVLAGRLQVSTTSFIGNESNLLVLSGGALNSTGNRDVTTAMIKNPIKLTANSAITTTSTASTVNLNLNTSTFTLTGGTTLTFRNDGADQSTDLFDPRFSGNGFDFTSNISIDNGLGKTRLASFNQGATTQTFSGVISGTGSFRRSSGTAANGGTTIFSNANTFQGGIALNDGKLQASNGTNGSATGTGQVTVGEGSSGTLFRGYLTGTGTVGDASTGPVVAQEGGTIAPGDVGGAPGTLTTLGDVMMNPNSHLAIELSGSLADKLAVGGALALAGGVLDVSGSPGAGPWTIATYVGTLAGTFASVTSGYSVDYGTGTNSQIMLSVVPVCAPGDLNCDGHVDAGDYVYWRKTNGPQADYDSWRANFGTPPGAGSGGGLGGGAVPEPSAIGLWLAGVALAAGWRRRLVRVTE